MPRNEPEESLKGTKKDHAEGQKNMSRAKAIGRVGIGLSISIKETSRNPGSLTLIGKQLKQMLRKRT